MNCSFPSREQGRGIRCQGRVSVMLVSGSYQCQGQGHIYSGAPSHVK